MWHLLDSFGITHYLEVFQGQRDQRCRQKLSLLNVLILWCDEQRIVVRFLWAKGHNPSEIHGDMCGVYEEDCMDHSNVSRWCSFFKVAIPWRMHITWRQAKVHTVFPIHVPVSFIRVRSMPFKRYPHYRPWRPTGDVHARVHIYTATALGRGIVASPMLGCLYPQGKTLVLIL